MQSRYPFSTALITGASSGLGRALALELGRHGVRVAIAARREPELASLGRAIRDTGGEVAELPADLATAGEAFRLAERAARALGNLDLVIANAGIGRRNFVLDLQWEEIERTFMVNTLGSIALLKAVLPAMIERRSGYLVGISSLASYRGLPGTAHYSGSKAALSTFLTSLRVETRGQGISVTDVHPGFIRTPMTAPNTNRMPFLMEPDRAASMILNAITRKKPVYNFPWQAALLIRLLRVLPARLLDRMFAGGMHR